MTEGARAARIGAAPAWLEAVAPDTEMGRLVLAHDWASTPLGDPSTWSTALRAAVSTCLTSRFAVLVVWGPELVKIYNDAYRPILGAHKHPGALGTPVAEVWPEIWDQIGPLFQQVVTTGEPTFDERELLIMERNGFVEHAWFTWSYSPLFDDDGTIGGVFDIASEVTDEVLARRRLQTLTELSRGLYDATHIAELCATAAATLAQHSPDLADVELYLVFDGQLALAASTRRGQGAVAQDLLEQVAREGETLVIGGHGGLAPAQRVVVPVGGSAGEPVALMSAGLDPYLAYDPDYAEFVELVASTLGAAIDNAYRHSTELGEYRRVSETLQGAMLTPVDDLPTVAARYLAAEGRLAVGGDWFDVIELDDGRRGLVVGDCVGHGLEAAAAMSQLRSAARAMLLEGRSPAEVLSGLDPLALSLPDAFCATAVCAVVDRGARSLTCARAGHLPPLLVHGGAADWLEEGGGPPLGLGSSDRSELTRRLEVGDLIALYSDGLVERRDEHIDVGLERLRAMVTELHGRPVQQLADELIGALVPHQHGDDVVLVLKQL